MFVCTSVPVGVILILLITAQIRIFERVSESKNLRFLLIPNKKKERIKEPVALQSLYSKGLAVFHERTNQTSKGLEVVIKAVIWFPQAFEHHG
jgi:hypothetical protein